MSLADMLVDETARHTSLRAPRLPLAALFDPSVPDRLWESLPAECRRKHFGRATMPTRYLASVREEHPGTGKANIALNLRDLPLPLTKEMAWLLHQEVELGRVIGPSVFNATTSVLRAAISGGGPQARNAVSLLSLTPHEWIRQGQMARLKGYSFGAAYDKKVLSRIAALQDVLCYPYHTGEWWQLNVWNPRLDPRIPRRDHEPQGRTIVNFCRLACPWLRESAKWWLAIMLESGQYTWTTLKTILDHLKWLQRHIDARGDFGPALANGPDELRSFFRSLARGLHTHSVASGTTAGQPLSKSVQHAVMSSIEQFYRWMYDNRQEAVRVLAEPRWLDLTPEHLVPFRREDKPRFLNRPREHMVLEDAVISQIAAGSHLLALPKHEGGLGDIQAFHILMLLLRTGRRISEILMLDFEPLRPLAGKRLEYVPDEEADPHSLVARLRYQQTKVVTDDPTIPVDKEIVSIVRAQQAVARTMMRSYGTDAKPKYLFLRLAKNRRGEYPYSAQTLQKRLRALSERLDICDSVGRRVHISRTHQFRHTKATNLLNAGVPIHIVMRYFGHVTPAMTMHYAKTLSSTAEEEFIRYQKVMADGKPLEKRADRILPNGWCLLPPHSSCDRGNACLSCSTFTTDESHREELCRQLDETHSLVEHRRRAFEEKFGCPMPEDNVWLNGRKNEQQALRRVLTALDRAEPRAAAVQGAGASDQAGKAEV